MVIASDELLECRVTPNGGQAAHYQWLVSKWHCSLWDRLGRTGETCRQTGCCHDKSHPAIFFLDDLRGRFQLCALMVRGSSSVDRRINDVTLCRMTNYELLRWLVEKPSRDVEHYHMFILCHPGWGHVMFTKVYSTWFLFTFSFFFWRLTVSFY